MKQSILFWIFAFLFTLAIAYYQRVTGPTHPVAGTVSLGGKDIRSRLKRSHGGSTDAVIKLNTDDESIKGVLEWRRYKTADKWTGVKMNYHDGALSAGLPHQPPAGKLQYRIKLRYGSQIVLIGGGKPVVIRFKGDVPLLVLIPHIIAMFGAMLLAARTGLECFGREPKLKKLTFWTLGFIIIGGGILGPVVQWYAFDALWTGWPFGHDLTDNKIAVALAAWTAAAVALYKSKNPRRWVLGAAIVMFAMYLIPHSLLGSELDYNPGQTSRV